VTETIREKIKSRLDELEANLKNGRHLLEHASKDEVVEVYKLTESISKFWRVLTDEEKDFIQVARIAILEQREWM
jgi:hypothetical protein